MALWFYDPIHSARRALNPFAGIGGLDHFMDDNFVAQQRVNAAKLDYDGKGNMVYTVDTTGYQPGEVQVHVEGDELVIEAEHKLKTDTETVHRHFTRRVRIPAGFKKESVKCELDEHGRLCVTAHKVAESQADRRTIPRLR